MPGLDVVLMFEVHQPRRLRKGLSNYFPVDPWTIKDPARVEEAVFDDGLNRLVIERAARKCYVPATKILLETAKELGTDFFKVSFSISGTALKQLAAWAGEALSLLQELASVGAAEFLAQTYYHSLAWFIGWNEFREQVLAQAKAIEELFGQRPRAAENTEMMYNNDIGCGLRSLGFRTIVTEGVDWILKGRPPTLVYSAWGCDARVLTRHYRLSDDIGYRFSDRSWDQWPLTADKYADWLSALEGQYVLIAVDYETFGEHHWPESGIHEFLRWLPREVRKRGLRLATVSEAAEHEPVGVYDVPPWATISWAEGRDTSSWLGNDLQRASFTLYTELAPYVMALGGDLLRLWRELGTSDHLYYQATKEGLTQAVHQYFSPFKDPVESFTTYVAALEVLARAAEHRIEERLGYYLASFRAPPGKEFVFRRPDGSFLGKASSVKEFMKVLREIPEESAIYHLGRGDFQAWFRGVLKAGVIAEELDALLSEFVSGGGANIKERVLKILSNHMR